VCHEGDAHYIVTGDRDLLDLPAVSQYTILKVDGILANHAGRHIAVIDNTARAAFYTEPTMSTKPPVPTRTRSHALQQRAERYFPGGVNSPVRAFKAVGGAPPFVESARERISPTRTATGTSTTSAPGVR